MAGSVQVPTVLHNVLLAEFSMHPWILTAFYGPLNTTIVLKGNYNLY